MAKARARGSYSFDSSVYNMFARRIAVFLCVLCMIFLAAAFPDGGSSPPVPGPGLSYGGIPYGSMSGNVAAFFKRQVPSSGRSANYASHSSNDYAPIEQWL